MVAGKTITIQAALYTSCGIAEKRLNSLNSSQLRMKNQGRVLN